MCAVLMTATACDVDLSGLNQLFDTDPTYLSLPGKRLASGQFKSISSPGGTDAEGAYVLAGDTADPQTLSVVAFDGSGLCNAGSIDRDSYRSFQFGTQSTLPIAFQYTRTEDDVRNLHFIDPHCQELGDPVPKGSLPFWPNSPTADPPGFLTLTGDGDFLVLRPWEEEKDTLAQGVRLIRPAQDKFWSLERHPDALDEPRFQLVIRDLSLKELGRVGDDVREFDYTDQAQERAAYIENQNVYVTRSPFDTSTFVDSDACEIGFPGGFHGRGFNYFSPCDDKQLTVYGSDRSSDPGPGKSDVKHTLLGPAVGDPAIVTLGGYAYAFFGVTDGQDPETITLYGGPLGSGTNQLGTAPRLSGGTPIITPVSDSVQFLLDYANGKGRLVRWKLHQDVKDVLADVHSCNGAICIANWDGTVGDAMYVPATGSPRKVASGVPDGGVAYDQNGYGVISGFDAEAGVGTLSVSGTDAKQFDVYASGVGVDGFAFLATLKAVAYLRDYHDGAGAAGVRVIDTGDTFDTNIRVSSFREISWPQSGILYVVPDGDDSGIWFAALK